jgi:hypothetical protein
MYTNIPLHILTNIIRNTLSKEEIPQVIIYEIDRITRLVLEQNYFQHNKIFYKQKRSSHGSPFIFHIIRNIFAIYGTQQYPENINRTQNY